tara:strand:- start:11687 stop:12544 length:858 start_codon:yes stop_codon:yes gene_type:complete
MNNIKKKGLGRGLSALFGDVTNPKSKTDFGEKQKIAIIGDLGRNQFQPRISFNEEKLEELTQSINKNGLIQPIAVRIDNTKKNKYEIIAGERRWLAAQRAGLNEVPIIILDINDNQALELAIIENIQRENLNAIEEAKAYERLKKEFRYDQEKISLMMSKSRSHITNTLRLLSLPQDVITMIEENLLSPGQARPLIGLSDPSSVAEEIVKKKLTARAVESMIRNKKSSNIQKEKDANISDVQNKIENAIGLKVIIKNKKNNSGKISIEYKNLDQFEMVSNLLKRS